MKRNFQLSVSEAEEFIAKIKRGEIEREILTNFAADFSGKSEQDTLLRYNAYLNSLSYDISRSID